MDARRAVTDDEIETFWRDGVVCLREILPLGLVESMVAPVEEAIAGPESSDLSAMGAALAASGDAGVLEELPEGARGAFVGGVDHWRTRLAFRDLACSGPVPEIVAAVLRSARLHLYEDSVLVKEPGTPERTAWHQDLSYFNVEGDQLATTWIPLDVVTAESGAMRFVRGSHRWDEVFQPNLFVSTTPIAGTDGRPVPDIDARPDAYDIVTHELGPGDLTIHHARTLHAAGGNRSERRRRAVSIRYCGDDARFRVRPGTVPKVHHGELVDGDPLGGPEIPQVWPR